MCYIYQWRMLFATKYVTNSHVAQPIIINSMSSIKWWFLFFFFNFFAFCFCFLHFSWARTVWALLYLFFFHSLSLFFPYFPLTLYFRTLCVRKHNWFNADLHEKFRPLNLKKKRSFSAEKYVVWVCVHCSFKTIQFCCKYFPKQQASVCPNYQTILINFFLCTPMFQCVIVFVFRYYFGDGKWGIPRDR